MDQQQDGSKKLKQKSQSRLILLQYIIQHRQLYITTYFFASFWSTHILLFALYFDIGAYLGYVFLTMLQVCQNYILHNIIFMQNTEKEVLAKQIKKVYDSKQQLLNLQSCANWQAVLKSKNWQCLIELNLRNCQLNDHAMKIISCFFFPSLKKLLLWKNQISNEGVKQIDRAKLPLLEFLDIDDNNIRNQGFQWIVKFHYLRTLQVSKNGINMNGLFGLVDNKHFSNNLKQLNLSQNPLGKEGAQMLSRIDFTQLIDLKINECCLGNAGVFVLSKSKFYNLGYLQITQNWIGVDGFQSLAKFKCNGLRFLNVNQYDHRDQDKCVPAIVLMHLCVMCQRKTNLSYYNSNEQFSKSIKQTSNTIRSYY